MKTIRVLISHASIKLNKPTESVYQLKDIKQPIYFRYHRSDREKGTFYLLVNKYGKSHWVKLGQFPLLSAKSAKEKAAKLVKQLEEKTVISSEIEFETVGELFSWYQERIENNKSISIHTKKNQIAVIRNHIIPCLGSTKIETLCLSKVNEKLFEPIQSKLSLSSIDNVLAVLNAGVKRALQVQLIKSNPLPECSLSSFTNQRPKIKETKLTTIALQSRIRTMNELCASHRMLLILLLLHGTRIGETVSSRWEDFDFNERLWRIPGKATKNKRAHILPLTDLAIEELKSYRSLRRSFGNSDYLFSQKGNRRRHISANQASAIISQMANKQWSAHDIRKYVRSQWMELGVDYMVGEFLLNHTLSKLDQTYIQTLAMPNCRLALELWHQYVSDNYLAR